ncbi:hypothetical protein COCSADRAFT_104554, partial [Bipolaris sorokiniana ND90Pr]
YTSLSWSALRQVSITLKVQFKLTTTRVIMKSIHPYILIASSPAIPSFLAIPRIVVMLGMAAIPRHPTIPQMVALSGIAHHVT